MAAIHQMLALHFRSCLYLMEEFYLKVKSAMTDLDDAMVTFI